MDGLGEQLKRLRVQAGLKRQQLAERADVSYAIVEKLELGLRHSARLDTLVALADALNVSLSALTDKRPRLDQVLDGRVSALRDVVLDPSLLTETPAPERGEPVPMPALESNVATAWRDYWAGRFSRLVAVLPDLVRQAREARRVLGPQGARPLAQAYQQVAALLVHMGSDDLAVLAAERAVTAAAAGDDQLQWAAANGTYSWCLLHQGRTRAAEEHAARIATEIEPSISRAALPELTVWGGLWLWAMAAAAAGERRDDALDYLGVARSAAGRFDRGDRLDYQTNFGATQVAMQATHLHAILGEPDRALAAAGGVRREDLLEISWGRHLLDVAQAHLHAADLDGAEETLLDAHEMSPEWFRHQGPGRAFVAELLHRRRRPSAELRGLGRSVDVDRRTDTTSD